MVGEFPNDGFDVYAFNSGPFEVMTGDGRAKNGLQGGISLFVRNSSKQRVVQLY